MTPHVVDPLSYWQALGNLAKQVTRSLSELHHNGYRGCVDVNLFSPIGANVYASVIPVEDGESLPSGWVRWKICDEGYRRVE